MPTSGSDGSAHPQLMMNSSQAGTYGAHPRPGTNWCEAGTYALEALLTDERSTLGAAILDITGRQAGILCASLTESNFIGPLHRATFRAIRALVGRNELPMEYNSVCAEMIRQGTFQSYTNGYSLVSSLGEGIVLAHPMGRRIELLRARAARYESRKAANA